MMKSAARYFLVLVALTFVAQAALAAPKAEKSVSLERQIGVPVYPGAKYLKHLAGMHAPGKKAYYFESNADPRTVAVFYEKKLHKKPGMFKGQNALVFPLSGKPPVIDEYVSVQPNVYGGTAKTVITIVRNAHRAKVKSKAKAKHK